MSCACPFDVQDRRLHACCLDGHMCCLPPGASAHAPSTTRHCQRARTRLHPVKRAITTQLPAGAVNGLADGSAHQRQALFADKAAPVPTTSSLVRHSAPLPSAYAHKVAAEGESGQSGSSGVADGNLKALQVRSLLQVASFTSPLPAGALSCQLEGTPSVLAAHAVACALCRLLAHLAVLAAAC